MTTIEDITDIINDISINDISIKDISIKDISTNDNATTKINSKIKLKKHKKELGQFYTTRQEYILQNLHIPDNIENIIEPFAGNADLLNFIETEKQRKKNINNNIEYKIECYDIDPKKDFIIKKDTILNPPNYNDKFIITNPPYLARNKSKDKSLFDKYDVNDLYKCLIKEILTNVCLGGIFIIPLNFWSSIRLNDIELRKAFLSKYKVIQLNIFEENVFDDTSYTICAFQFEQDLGNPARKREEEISVDKGARESSVHQDEPARGAEALVAGFKKSRVQNDEQKYIDNKGFKGYEAPLATIYPSKTNISIELNDNNNYMIGGDIYKLQTNNKYKITRLTSRNKEKSNTSNINTNILVKCIDDNIKNKIGLSYVSNDDIYIDDTPNQTARTYATLIIEPSINQDKQKILVNKFNKFLDEYRKKYNSLFLTNYRESKDIARKRISFDLVYLIVEHILDNFDIL